MKRIVFGRLICAQKIIILILALCSTTIIVVSWSMLCPQRRTRKEATEEKKKTEKGERSVNATRILCNELNNFTSLLLEIFNKPLDNNFYDRECIILKIVYKNIGTIIF